MDSSGPVIYREQTPLTRTTSRGLATASLTLGLWGTFVFWWYPLGLCFASVGFVLGVISLLRGVRVSGQPGDHLAYAGVIVCSIGITASILVYRGVQLLYENPYWFNMP
jgi:hypothetical protein